MISMSSGAASAALEHGLGLRVGDLLDRLAGLELGVEVELVAAVDGRHEGAAVAVHRPIHPGARMRDRRRRALALRKWMANIRPPMKSRTHAAFADIAVAQRLAGRAARRRRRPSHRRRAAWSRLPPALLGIDLDASAGVAHARPSASPGGSTPWGRRRLRRAARPRRTSARRDAAARPRSRSRSASCTISRAARADGRLKRASSCLV